MSAADGTAAANDATATTNTPVEKPGAAVEMDDGWTVTADTPEQLAAIIDRKLEQARQARTDADAAIKRWTAAAKKTT